MRAIYTRLNAVRDFFAWDLEAGIEWLTDQEEAGLISAVGVFDDETGILHVPEDLAEPFTAGDGVTDYYGQLLTLGIVVKKIETYALPEALNNILCISRF